MKRFRITILAVCLILAWLGFKDVSLMLRNQEPLSITIAELEANGAPQEWLSISGGVQDLLQGINMTGTMDIDSFLVPLKQDAGSPTMKIWFETRDPEIIAALKTYYFTLNEEKERATFVAKHGHLFMAPKNLTGMTADNLVANSNRNKLTKLLEEMNIPVSDDTIFISEGKEPARWRGIFFSVVAVIGLIKIFSSFARQKEQ